jgi:hypothetical protein
MDPDPFIVSMKIIRIVRDLIYKFCALLNVPSIEQMRPGDLAAAPAWN